MALAQSLPDQHTAGPGTQLHPPAPAFPSSPGAMGSVSSLISGHGGAAYHARPNLEVSTKLHQASSGAGRFNPETSQQPLLSSHTPNRKRQAIVGKAKGIGSRSFSHEDLIRDWEDHGLPPDNLEMRVGESLNGNMDGPPKLVPVSGKLERNMEKAVIRPTAFKPVVPKNRTSMQYLSPRLGGGLSGSQGNLTLLSPGQGDITPQSSERRSSYSGARAGLVSQSFSMSDSGRNSLTNLPTYNGTVYNLGQSEGPGGHLEPTKPSLSHGHSNSDSGRSSSSKSTGSLSGRGQQLSETGSAGRSPPPIEAYEIIVRDLEEKLRERDLELQQLRENLDENEAAICQVYEEKQKRSELEMEELRQSCASKMQLASQKAQRAQQVLQLQVFQLQQEKKKLQEDFGQLLQERERLEERCASYEREHTQLGPRLEETKWEVCQKSGEISLLKQQLKDLQADLAQRVGEVVALRGQLREARNELQNCQSQLQEAHTASRTRTLELEVCENELQRRKSENELLREKLSRVEEESNRLREALSSYDEVPHSHKHESGLSPSYCGGEDLRVVKESDEVTGQRQGGDPRQQVEHLRAELSAERQHAAEQAARFEDERRSWEEEKDKVIRYQKQLQQNYVQMYRRNRELERELRELSLELETRELDDESSGNEITFDEVTATEI
ncbi:leucine zipper putative tumor suppressor 2 homolog [Chanos chanos]|uniref:Leucine zipper putative tumor suppressor 2 homolog n=1 Tax=Chanos chanos TaxID=29144 RepID=A0A6J2VFQ4_CHACN|nr:leucine zipper putative tumor suppressor 2 homolog [Chanos chanos]